MSDVKVSSRAYLFHQCLSVTPMGEIALVEVEAMAAEEGLQIAGYYAAAENFNDNSIEKVPGARIVEKISEYLNNAVKLSVVPHFDKLAQAYTND